MLLFKLMAISAPQGGLFERFMMLLGTDVDPKWTVKPLNEIAMTCKTVHNADRNPSLSTHALIPKLKHGPHPMSCFVDDLGSFQIRYNHLLRTTILSCMYLICHDKNQLGKWSSETAREAKTGVV
jgi:hypothetical protein